MFKARIAKIRSIISGNGSRAVTTGVIATIVIALTAWYIISSFMPLPVPQAQVYFYDLGAKRLFVADMANIPPILAPSQQGKVGVKPLGVRAVVYACGDCAKVDHRFVAYVEAYSTEARQILVERAKGPGINYDMGPNERRNDPSAAGLLVSPPNGDNWISVRDDPDGARSIMSAPDSRCGSASATRCYPTS